MIVGVKHNPTNKKVYWFNVPGQLSSRVSLGCSVICETENGLQPGIVKSIISGEENALDGLSIPSPTENIHSVMGVMKVSDIVIPAEMSSSIPNGYKLELRIAELFETWQFNTKIIVDSANQLQDGYTAYLIAKAFDKQYLRVRYV